MKSWSHHCMAPPAGAIGGVWLTFLDACPNCHLEGPHMPDHTPEHDSPLTTQVGGAHYTGLVIQPVTYIHANNIPFCEGSVIKYMTRWRDKGGIQDLQKARHFIDLLIELERVK